VAKYGRFNLPGSFVPGGGRLGLKYGSSRKIRDIWQPYMWHSGANVITGLNGPLWLSCTKRK